jgi:pimeloyl-ACP methyl ester carboxylesterase
MGKLPEDLINLQKDAVVHWFPCGEGRMPIRQWKNAGAEKVVLFHGGSGSWLHWARNIPVLREHLEVYAIDLPGLGDAAMCEVESDAVSAALATRDALGQLFDSAFHVVAFSWGCTVTAMIMKDLAALLKSVMLTGPAAVGDLPRKVSMKPLIKRVPGMSGDEVLAAQKENLARLMIYQRSRIDDTAVIIQQLNTSRARFRSPPYARGTLVIDGVQGTTTPLFVIYGDHDAPAHPDLEARRDIFQYARPDVRFELVADAGHWLQYEMPELFNERCIEWVNSQS